MSNTQDRLRIARSILDFEARRDAQGRLAIYQLPADDGGGSYEVAGINERHHPREAKALADLIRAGRHAEAETQAISFIATFTDVADGWTARTAIESYLRDSAFNRGPKGAARILQRAVGVDDDGVVGTITRTAIGAAEADPAALLAHLRKAREAYEREVVGRDETSRFWQGLVNRWNKALAFARTFLPG
jgi:lysozyme family protein